MYTDVRSRLARIEKEAGANYPVFAVTFMDGSRRKMRAYELYFYAVNRALYIAGYENDGGVFAGEPLPVVPFVDYILSSGDPALLSPFMENEINHMKGR